MFRVPPSPVLADPHQTLIHKSVHRSVLQVQSPPVLRMLRATSNQSLTANTVHVVQFNSETIDTHSWWDSTNYRYTPQEAGYYRVTARLSVDADTTATNAYLFGYIYKNGAEYAVTYVYHTNSDQANVLTLSDIVKCDGSTDYIDIRVHAPAGATAWVLQSTANRTCVAIDYLGGDQIR